MSIHMRKVMFSILILVGIVSSCKTSKFSCSQNNNKRSANTLYARNKSSNNKYVNNSFLKKINHQQKKCTKW